MIFDARSCKLLWNETMNSPCVVHRSSTLPSYGYTTTVVRHTCALTLSLKVAVHVLACKLLWLILCVVCKH